MSFLRALKKLGSATVKTALLPVDIVLDSVGAPLLRDGDKQGTPFSWDRAKSIGKDLSAAYEETSEE